MASVQLDRNKIFATSDHILVNKIKINYWKLHLYLNANKSASYDHLKNMIKITLNIAGHGDSAPQLQLMVAYHSDQGGINKDFILKTTSVSRRDRNVSYCTLTFVCKVRKIYEKSVKTAAFHTVYEMFTATPTCSVPSIFCSFDVSAFHTRVILQWDLKPALCKVIFS